MLKVAVIGAGYLGRHHARIYSTMEGVELAAIADTDEARAREVAAAYGGRACRDYRDILGLVNAVSIVTPTVTHYQIAADCFALNKDVLLEKPICLDLHEADRLVKMAAEKMLILQAGHVERFNPVLEEAYQRLGQTTFIEAERVSPFPARSTDVDVTLDMMIHDIDIVLHTFGCPDVKSVKAAGASILTDKLDTVKAWVDFTSGHSAFFSASRVCAHKKRVMKFVEKNRIFTADFMSKKLFLKTPGGDFEFESPATEPLKEELADFIKCVGGRTAPRVSPKEARGALDLALRISDAARRPDQQ
ncbi:MAG: Gfo/Idh/MocA family oxidoreductase [Actinomycetota bacterium]|nr:Gfo/Idh/MocA family oxidoreductase [Actinomycetota bacterium]